MTQVTNYVVENLVMATARGELNGLLDGAKTLNKGATAPANPAAGMLWLDDTATPWLLKVHDGTDWITLGEIDATTNQFAPYLAGSSLADAVRQAGAEIYAADSGAADAYVVTLASAIATYVTGLVVRFKAANASASGTATLNVNGKGVKALLKGDGGAVVAGDIAAGQPVEALYDGAAFRLISPVANGDTAASQAQMEAASAGDVYVSPARAHNHPSAAKAWASWDGVADTINASYNVSSITDSGVGVWRVDFATAFSTANYSVAVAASGGAGIGANVSSLVVNAATVIAFDVNGTFVEPALMTAAFFGDQ